MSNLALQKGYLFIGIPRTGSSSICRTLNADFGHDIYTFWKDEIGNEWKRIFKFTIVRNPYDRFLSMYYFFDVFDKNQDPNEFLEKNKLEEFAYSNNRYPLLRPQTDYIHDGKNFVVDYLGRFEKLDESWKEICKHTKTHPIELPHLKQTQKKFQLNRESKQIIHKFYHRDFELLDY